MNKICGLRWCDDNNNLIIKAAIDELVSSGAGSILILGCEGDHWRPDNAVFLRDISAPVFGGLFPSVIYQGRCFQHGTLLLGFSHRADVAIVQHLSSAQNVLEENIRKQCKSMTSSQSHLIIVDGFARNIEFLLETLYALIGPGADIVGGGAGSLDFVQKPCLLTNEGLVQDSAIIVSLPDRLYRGAQHGWEILDGPFLVTGSHGNLLETLNYLPAFDIYRELVEPASGMSFDKDDFFSIAKIYPFGIEQFDGDILVRDPVRCLNKSMVCVGNVPENTTVYLLKGEAEHLIQSAGNAVTEAVASMANHESETRPAFGLVFDCISRALLLDEQFDQELRVIHERLSPECQAFGVLSLGEITNLSNGPINLLNKSTVIGVF